MIKSRTHIKLLKRLGLLLIALPEPFTTPFGVALILVARHLSKKREDSRNKRLQETIQYYLAHTSRFSGDVNGKPSVPSSIKLLNPSKEQAILGTITGSRSLESNAAPSVGQSRRDVERRLVHHTTDTQNPSQHFKAGDSYKIESGWSDTSSRTEKMIHHTINTEWLSQCYEGQSTAMAHSSWANTSGAVEGVMQHSDDEKLLPQRYQIGSAGQASVKYHTINMALLRQRYGAAMYKMALKSP
jgi:hypothetical protein